MRSRNRIIAAALVTCGLVAGATGIASAARPAAGYQPPVVEWVSPVVHAQAGSNSAVVHGKYHCSGGNVGTHLYIGVKQGPQVNATDHTSSQYAQTFYSTNWNSDGPGLRLICDGRSHNKSFVVKPDPYFWNAEHAPPLKSGKAFVQFCLFDSTNQGENDPNGFAFDYSMRKVVVNRG
jgi:hypothetical protein